MVISGACLIHCLAVPLIFALLPVLATIIYMPEALHLWLVVIAVPVSGYALLLGRGAKSGFRPLASGAGGLTLLIGATAASGVLETALTVAGGLLLAAAHVLNWRRRHPDKVIDR